MHFQVSFHGFRNMWPSVVMLKNYVFASTHMAPKFPDFESFLMLSNVSKLVCDQLLTILQVQLVHDVSLHQVVPSNIEFKFIVGVVQALHFMNEIRYWSYDHHELVYSGRFFGPNFPPLWHTFRPERWQFRVGCCLWGRLKLPACWHRPVTWYGPIKKIQWR